MKKSIYVLLVFFALVIAGYSARGGIRDFFANFQKAPVLEETSYDDVRNETGPANTNSSATANVNANGIEDTKPNDSEVAPRANTNSTNTAPSQPAPTPTEPTATIKASVNLAVPFQAQAPFADWVMPYKEACEEASIIMVDFYLRGASLSKQQMKDEIDRQVAWQETEFGGHFDIPIIQVKQIADHFYDYKTEIIPNLTPEKIKQQLSLGRPVVVPSAGRDLGNPNFTPPGPFYHMLVVTGYKENGDFITNDPGTRNGAKYVYSEEVLMAAIRDWDGNSPDGGAIGLVLYK